MARWNTFFWSDGTLWADGLGSIEIFNSFIDRLAHHVSARITQSTPSGTTVAPTIHSVAAEVGQRAQNQPGYEAFIDRTTMTQRMSVRVTQTGRDDVTLLTEASTVILTEDSESLELVDFYPFSLDIVRVLTNQRSRQQPTG